MGKLTQFKITLDSPNAVYQAGTVLQGNVIVELSESMKMRGIRLKFHGAADVHWSERHTTGSGKNRRTTTRHYRANETYFDYVLTLYGKAPGDSGDNPVHPPGYHTYPFHYTLPPNLPSSFEGAWGHVRYSLKCTIDKPWKFDHTCKLPYTVLSILDLNQRPDVLVPQTGSDSKTLCCLCCESGPISASFHIDRCGFVPGEYITLSGEVTNRSNRTMSNSRVELRMHTVFHATTKSRGESKEVAAIRKGEIQPGESEVWSGERFHIPALPPSELIHCRIIDIDYHIVLVVDPSGPAFDLEVPLKILIGTIPLRDIYSSFASAPPAFSLYNDTSVITSVPPPSASVPSGYSAAQLDVPPPSYSECVLGKVDVREEEDSEYTFGDMNYAPVYTYYNWGQQMPPSAPPLSGGMPSIGSS